MAVTILGQEQDDPVSLRLAQIGYEFDSGIKLETIRILEALERLGRPQDRCGPVIHVAGTNGKGSTCAYLRAIAEASGLVTHVFTSPHLVRPNERIRVAGKLVDDAAFLAALDKLEQTGVQLTFFESITAAAFILFAQRPADLVVMEVGLGGRLDGTNVFTRPAATIITPIDMDHAHILGETRALIAAEKAGIMKRNSPAVIARQPEDAADVLERYAHQVGAPLVRCGVEWDGYQQNGRLIVQTEDRLFDLPPPSLFGPHQFDNAALAVRAALELGDPRITEETIGRGIASAQWPGRMQPLTRGILAAPVLKAGGELWLDGGHNAHAGIALGKALDALKARSPRKTIIVAGMLANKDMSGFLEPLASRADGLVAVPVHGSRSSREPEEVAQEARVFQMQAKAAGSLPEAMELAVRMGGSPRVLICGSLYLAGEALALSDALPE